MKRALIPVVVLLGLFAGSGAAVAAPPTPVQTTETFDCPGFQVEAQTTGKAKVLDKFPHHLVDSSKPMKFYTNLGADVTMTLTALTPAAKSVSYKLNGTIWLSFDFSINDLVIRMAGKNLITVPKVYGIPGIFYTSGQLGYAESGPVYPNAGLTGPGKVTDVCALLAP
jgi:hypothetical protein